MRFPFSIISVVVGLACGGTRASGTVPPEGCEAHVAKFVAAGQRTGVTRLAREEDGNPRPAPVPALRGVRLNVLFAVDTTGAAMIETLHVRPGADTSGLGTVREVLQHWRFVPGTVDGCKVRQLVQQTFEF
jgi:hypothetical protein